MIPREAILEEARRTASLLRPARAAWVAWIQEHLFQPLSDLLERVARLVGGLLLEGGGRVLLVLLIAAAAVLLGILLARLFRREQERVRARSGDRISRGRGGPRDPEGAEAEAAGMAREGRFREAVRLLYLATFLRLSLRSGRPFDPSLTPGENLRPFREEPWHGGLREFVRGYLAASFGEAPLDAAAYADLRSRRPPPGAP